ncbi:MAG: homoserine kinase [Dehalococcoidia bacterium]|nr:homoserine kinase [Dehalococcoidia bacterium]
MEHVTVRVPATSANLGPGFDCMGMALRWYATVRVTRSERFTLSIRGHGAATLPRDESNLVHVSFARAYAQMKKTPPVVAIRCNNAIPLDRGLGSSSAAIVGGLAAANALEGSPLDDDTLLALATEIEGHPDNVAPALLGGVQVVICGAREPEAAAGDAARGPMAAAVQMKRGLRGVAFVPDAGLSTKKARGVLPKQVSRADAVFNAGRTALLVLALSQGRWELLGAATEDRLHQPQRAGLFPPMLPLFHAARQAGARGIFLSGAGPAVLALTDGDAAPIARAFERAARRLGVPGAARTVGLAARGAHVIESR